MKAKASRPGDRLAARRKSPRLLTLQGAAFFPAQNHELTPSGAGVAIPICREQSRTLVSTRAYTPASDGSGEVEISPSRDFAAYDSGELADQLLAAESRCICGGLGHCDACAEADEIQSEIELIEDHCHAIPSRDAV